MRDELLKLVFPRGVRCMVCGEKRLMNGENCLCARCAEALESQRVPAASCDKCLSHVPLGESCCFCKDGGMEGIEKGYAPFRYGKAPRALIMSMKFHYADDGAPLLTQAMANALPHRQFDLIVPVPLHAVRKRERGCNQAMVLSQGVSARTGVPVSDALVRIRATRPQSTLGHGKDRRSNVDNAFVLSGTEELCGKHVLLVDDVRTSGSTARACAKVLLEGGAARVSLLTACVVWNYREEKHGKVAGKNGAAAGQRGAGKTE